MTLKEGQTFNGTIHSPVLRDLQLPEATKSLWIMGPSGIGKTTWAKNTASKPSLFVTHMDDLARFKPAYHKSIIFDDMKFTHYPEECQIHIVDRRDNRSLHMRYRTALVPAGVEKIFLSNYPIFADTEPINNRLIKVNLYSQ